MRLARLLVLGAVFASFALPVAAQGTITVRSDSAKRSVFTSSSFGVPVYLDMSAAAGADVASISLGVSFGTSRLTFDSVKAGTFGALTPNTTNAAAGNITLTVADVTATTVTQSLATLYFTASPTIGWSTIAFAPTSATAGAGANLLAMLRTLSLDVCLPLTFTWADVNDDGVVNIVDAQQVARWSVGLAVGNAAAVAERSDVNADGVLNIIDAQQVARWSVGLSAAARINTKGLATVYPQSLTVTPGPTAPMVAGDTLRVVPTARDAANADITPCARFTWATTNAVVAAVSSTGLVTAHASGTTTVSATTAGLTAGVTVTVTGGFAAAATVTTPGTSFSPASVDIATGGAVTWNVSGLSHSVAFDAVAGAPANIPVGQGSVARTFNTAGTFNYHCTVHAGMAGAVVVH